MLFCCVGVNYPAAGCEPGACCISGKVRKEFQVVLIMKSGYVSCRECVHENKE